MGGSAAAHRGLSPRVRGNPHHRKEQRYGQRSIPACAGEPSGRCHCGPHSGVYPRVCGGTLTNYRPFYALDGLSPRVRGNHVRLGTQQAKSGSIPACAGEPGPAGRRTHICGVYPRVCGGTARTVPTTGNAMGLSPRVRGNLPLPPLPPAAGRSIPACAGEPPMASPSSCRSRVYPRVCGGTPSFRAFRWRRCGLSPRVRGNQATVSPNPLPARSIPACAGEPGKATVFKAMDPVYPRVCGGTQPSNRNGPGRTGLSPRVRGNLDVKTPDQMRGGSIPACAGEPGRRWRFYTTGGVYPRVCGGTPAPGYRMPGAGGLSPRVRGNRGIHGVAGELRGSIPACAGEPADCSALPITARVYPRVCGGTPH